MKGNENERNRDQDRQKEQIEAVNVSAHPEQFDIFVHTLSPSFCPLHSPSSRDRGFPSFNLVSHSKVQYQRRYVDRKEKHQSVFSHTILSTAVISVMLSNGVSWLIYPLAVWLSLFHLAKNITAVLLSTS